LLSGKTQVIEICKFCNNPLSKTELKGHDKIFCSEECNITHYQIKEEKKKLIQKDPSIIGIIWEPEIIENEVITKNSIKPRKYRVPERIIMKIIREGNPNKEDWEPLTSRKRTSKKDD